jgi:hypothetical protein
MTQSYGQRMGYFLLLFGREHMMPLPPSLCFSFEGGHMKPRPPSTMAVPSNRTTTDYSGLYW